MGRANVVVEPPQIVADGDISFKFHQQGKHTIYKMIPMYF